MTNRFLPVAAAAGAEADCFALDVWPDLRTAGGFRQVSSQWVNGIAQLVWSCNANAAQQVRSRAAQEREAEEGAGETPGSSSSSRRRRGGGEPDSSAASYGNGDAVEAAEAQDMQQQQQQISWRPKNNSPPNYPSPCLLGSPFTTLAVTHNYHSLLHAEPREHPFSYIVWLDVLGPGSEMQVGRLVALARTHTQANS
jgi:hypothetical protein